MVVQNCIKLFLCKKASLKSATKVTKALQGKALQGGDEGDEATKALQGGGHRLAVEATKLAFVFRKACGKVTRRPPSSKVSMPSQS